MLTTTKIMSYCQQGNLPNSGDGWATVIGDTPPSVAVLTASDDWDISVVFPSSEKNKPKKV